MTVRPSSPNLCFCIYKAQHKRALNRVSMNEAPHRMCPWWAPSHDSLPLFFTCSNPEPRFLPAARAHHSPHGPEPVSARCLESLCFVCGRACYPARADCVVGEGPAEAGQSLLTRGGLGEGGGTGVGPAAICRGEQPRIFYHFTDPPPRKRTDWWLTPQRTHTHTRAHRQRAPVPRMSFPFTSCHQGRHCPGPVPHGHQQT